MAELLELDLGRILLWLFARAVEASPYWPGMAELARRLGMRDFVVRDPDGHRFTLGRGEDRLREAADYYGLSPDEISVNPECLDRQKPVP